MSHTIKNASFPQILHKIGRQPKLQCQIHGLPDEQAGGALLAIIAKYGVSMG